MNRSATKGFLWVILLLVTNLDVAAQRFFSVNFSALPRDMQMYAREDDNSAEVPIVGQIEAPGWDHMSVVTYRNKERYSYSRSKLEYGGKSVATFSMKPLIKAELADYDVEVYACHAADSVLMVSRKDLAAGDFYVITGQSNGNAIQSTNESSKYWRTIARIPDNLPNITDADTSWVLSAWSWPVVGAWGMEIQKQASEQFGIPTCVINGSLPGSKLDKHYDRNLSGFALYGNLYQRIRVANPKRIRGFFWVHGEQEVFENLSGYDAGYDKLFKLWLQDYPMVEQYYVAQANLVFNPVAGSTRDFLRRTKYLYPKTDHYATVGIPGYDGVHYTVDGYRAYGNRVFDLIAPRVYGVSDTVNIKSPDIMKAYYSSPKKDEITLVFDDGQDLFWQPDTTMRGQNGQPLLMSLTNVFYLNGDESKKVVKSGRVSGNRAYLTLNAPATGNKISYMPSLLPPNLPLIEPASLNIGWYTGPYLVNKRGFGAFTFDNVTLAEVLEIKDLVAKDGGGNATVSWRSLGSDVSFLIDRKEEGKDFARVAVITGASEYIDRTILSNIRYTYRIMATSKTSESQPVEASMVMDPVLGLEPGIADLTKVYPNPAIDKAIISFPKPVSGSLKVYDKGGQSVYSTNLVSAVSHTWSVTDFAPGLYIVSVEMKDGVKMSYKLLR